MTHIYSNNSKYWITSIYGERNLGSGVEMHHGIDFVSSGSLEVLAVKRGIVEKVVTNIGIMDLANPRGNYVRIRHNDNSFAYYQHLSSVLVNLGDNVEVGTIVGIQGNTGRVYSSNGGSGSHLHLEFRNSSNVSINPANIIDIPNQVGYYTPTDEVVPKEPTDTELPTGSEYSNHYSADVNGKYEPIYEDLTKPPKNYNTSSYDSSIKASSAKSLFAKNKTYSTLSLNEPYPVDNKIVQLESHAPKIVFNEAEITRLNNIECEDIQIKTKLEEIIESLDILSKRVEKRMVQTENINATNMRYLHRLSSRVNINCVYYGGQSIYDKYLCIRCLDNDLINDTPVSLDQCLNCDRYEPVIGQVYDIEKQIGDTINTSILIDDKQSARQSNDDIVNNVSVNKYSVKKRKLLSSLSEPTENVEVDTTDWRETAIDEQVPSVKSYKVGHTIEEDTNAIDTVTENSTTVNIEDFVDYNISTPDTVMHITNTMALKIVESEGFAATKYKDGIRNGIQYYSIGYGHQIVDGENYDNGITKEEAFALFKKDISTREQYIINICKANGVYSLIRQNQFDSLVCTVYSLGPRSNILNAAIKYIKDPINSNAEAYKKEMSTTGIYMQTFVDDPNNPGQKISEMRYNKVLYNRRMYEYEIFMYGRY